MINKPKISIITVVYNSVLLIERTIKSIINQTYSNIEYIIIDGKSTDGTLDLIEKYKDRIQVLISEPDNGLYDAMNKGIKKSFGEYLLFINSGDELYSNTTLENIFNNPIADVYYGDTIITDNTGNEIGLRRLRPPVELTFNSLKKGMLVCHQSFIVRKELVPLFSLNYKHSADYNWILEIVKNAEKIVNTNFIISRFLEGGQTSSNVYQGLMERFAIMKKHYSLLTAIMLNISLIPRFLGYLITKKI